MVAVRPRRLLYVRQIGRSDDGSAQIRSVVSFPITFSPFVVVLVGRHRHQNLFRFQVGRQLSVEIMHGHFKTVAFMRFTIQKFNRQISEKSTVAIPGINFFVNEK